MKTLRTLLLLTIALLVAVSALAEPLALKASGAETSPDRGSAVDIGLRRHLTVSVNLTTGSGVRRRTRTISRRGGKPPPDRADLSLGPCRKTGRAGRRARPRIRERGF